MRWYQHWFQVYQSTVRWISAWAFLRARQRKYGQTCGENPRKRPKRAWEHPTRRVRYRIVAMLCPWQGLCYNHRAVERAWKQEAASIASERDAAVSAAAASASHDPRKAAEENRSANVDRVAVAADVDRTTVSTSEDASRYCPVCSRRLESKRCKLICPECGYYMSCADYY
jgi:hypothetical protein